MKDDWYLQFPDCFEYCCTLLFRRDWLRMKMLIGPSGGLTPPEAKDWILYREARDDEWHKHWTALECYLIVIWGHDIDANRHLPFHLHKWVLRSLAEDPLINPDCIQDLDETFIERSYGSFQFDE